MNRLTLFITFMLLCMFPMNAIAFIPDGDEEDPDPEEIDINKQQTGSDPTSLNICEVHAFKVGNAVMISISGYTGNASAVVFCGGMNTLSNDVWINGYGSILLDITIIPEGECTLYIQASGTYTGYFRK